MDKDSCQLTLKDNKNNKLFAQTQMSDINPKVVRLNVKGEHT